MKKFLASLLLILVCFSAFSAAMVTAAEIEIVPTVRNYNIPMLMTTESFEYFIGDVNSDGLVTVKDATFIQKYIVGGVELDEKSFLAGDVNVDGVLSVRDASLITEYIAENR